MCAHDPLPRDRTYAEPRLPRWPCAHSGFDTPQQVTAVAAEPFPNVRRVGAVCRQQSARASKAHRALEFRVPYESIIARFRASFDHGH